MARRSKRGGARQYDDAVQVGFSGDSRNMKGSAKVPCRVINDWTHVPHGAHFYQRGDRQGEPKRVPVFHTLSWFDHFRPDSVGTFAWDS